MVFLIGYNTRDISNNKFLIKVEKLFKLNKDFKKEFQWLIKVCGK